MGKVALEPCFSTHKMCYKSEHQKCRRYEKWILLAEYIGKVLRYAENTQLIADNGCFEVENKQTNKQKGSGSQREKQN